MERQGKINYNSDRCLTCSGDMEFIVQEFGIETAKRMLEKLGGLSLYIPKRMDVEGETFEFLIV